MYLENYYMYIYGANLNEFISNSLEFFCSLKDKGFGPLFWEYWRGVENCLELNPRKIQLPGLGSKQCSKIGKNAISKVQKHLFAISKMAKNQFLHKKKVLKYQKCYFRTFFWCKNWFLPFLKLQIMCFCTFEITLFF